MRFNIAFLGILVLLLGAFCLVPSLFSKEGNTDLYDFSRARGRIYDFENRLLAESRSTKGLFLSTTAFVATPKNINSLAKALGENPEQLRFLLAQREGTILLRQEVSEPLVKELEDLPGILFLDYYKRIYPFGDSTASLLGQVSQGGQGLSGLEASYDTILRSPEAILRTSINIDLEQRLYRDIVRAQRLFHAREGAGVVMELKTGRLLGLVSTSSVNPLLHDTLPLSVLGKPFEEAFLESSYRDWGGFLRALGFGEPTRIDLPGESLGLLPPEVDDLSEVMATPLQMTRGLAALVTGRVFCPKVVWKVKTKGETYTVGVGYRLVPGLEPLKKGGLWWWGGNRKAGAFVLAGLWPKRSPQLAYFLYLKGVKVWGLPVYPTRVVPGALRVYQFPGKEKIKRASWSPRVMPDVRGLTLRAALERLSRLGLEVQFSGFGVTVRQWPAPGTPLKNIKKCRLVLADEDA